METSLHRQLKMHYATDGETEVVLNEFRIDAIGKRGELIEIQHASLGSIREKTKRLLSNQNQKLRIVKPILARKTLITFDEPEGQEIRRRLSPKRGDVLDIFLDLVHFGQVFPHPKLTLEIALIEAEELRIDRAQTRHRGKRYKCLDQRLVAVHSRVELKKIGDLLAFVPLTQLPNIFDTAELAAAMSRPRWFAQKVAYCLRQSGATKIQGKRGNSQLYQAIRTNRRSSAKAITVA
jgi:hypothetical protein